MPQTGPTAPSPAPRRAAVSRRRVSTPRDGARHSWPLATLVVVALGVAGCGSESGTGTADNPAPVLGSISPTAVEAGSGATTLTVTGSGFVEQSSVSWNGGSRPTSFVSPSRLTATIPASDLVSAGTATVRVSSPAPGGGSSESASFAIEPPAVASIQVDALGEGVVPGSTITLTATLRSQTGTVLTDRSVDWSTDDADVATVDDGGVVSALAAGVATIRAASEGAEGAFAVEVLPGGMVDASGGTVATDGVVLTFDPGAVDAPTAVTVVANATPPADSMLVTGTAFDLGPDGATFAADVRVRIGYSEQNLPNGVAESQLALHRWDGSTWVSLPEASADPGANHVSAITPGFSTFAVVAREPTTTWVRSEGNPATEWLGGYRASANALGRLWVVTGFDPAVLRSTADGVTWDALELRSVGLPDIPVCGAVGVVCTDRSVTMAGTDDELVITLLLDLGRNGPNVNAEGHNNQMWVVRGGPGDWTAHGPTTPGLDQASPGPKNFRVSRLSRSSSWGERVVTVGETQWWEPFSTSDVSFVAWANGSGDAWAQFAQDAPPFGGSRWQRPQRVAGSALGFFAIGTDGDDDALWYSSDGYAWSGRDEPSAAAGPYPSHGAILGSGSAVVRARFRDSPTPEVVAWRTTDGDTWDQVPVGPVAQTNTHDVAGFWTGTRFVLHAHRSGFPDRASRLWSSDDGLDWTQLPDTPIPAGGYLLSVGDRLITWWGSDLWMLDLPASPN